MFSMVDFSSLSELLSLSVASGTLLSLGLFGLASHCSCGSCESSEEETDPDAAVYEELEGRINELKTKVEQGDVSLKRELADTVLALAVQLQQDGYIDDSIETYDEAVAEFSELCQENADDWELVRVLGLVNLSRAVALNDLGEQEAAVEGYEDAMKILTPVANTGDGEAKYDIAGIKLNCGMIFHDLGEWDKAKQMLEESFLEFRALEKISELDTRFYMGKVSVALGNLMRDLEEPINSIVDVYNRAMRLFVELIDAGDMKYEHDLANALIEKCMARYEAGAGEDVLVDLQRGIEILENAASEDPHHARLELFSAQFAYGSVLYDLEKYADAISVFSETLEKFADIEKTQVPILLGEYATVLDHRGMCYFALQKPDAAIADLTQAIHLLEKIWNIDDDGEEGMDEVELIQISPVLVSAYCNRAAIYHQVGKKDLAVDDCKAAMNVLEPYKDMLGEEFAELQEQIEAVRDSIK
ncbi:MAG: tetratricopeptide repeat protein [Thermoguttaceae bacterium]